MIDLTTFYQDRDQLADKILHHMYPNEPFDDAYRKEKSLEDIRWTLLFITEGIRVNNTAIVENLLVWLRRIFKGLNIPDATVDLLYRSTKAVLKKVYKDKQLHQYLDDVVVYPMMEYPELMEKNPYKEEKDHYLNALLQSDRNKAYELVQGMVQRNVSIEHIYLYVFQEAMREIGMLWQDGVIDVGREHYATAVTQFVMSSLYEEIFKTAEHLQRKMMACAVGSELHEMGIRMVADLFQMHGWDTDYLGANLPLEYIISYAKEHKPDLIALSITMPYHIGVLQETIKAIRAEQDLKRIRIMVGGRPFLFNKDLVESLDADAYAPNAVEGIKIANQLLQ